MMDEVNVFNLTNERVNGGVDSWGSFRASGDRPSTKIKVRTCSY